MILHLVTHITSAGYCPDGFDDWKEDNPTWTHCYIQERHTNITWFEARDNCTSKGGSLLS